MERAPRTSDPLTNQLPFFMPMRLRIRRWGPLSIVGQGQIFANYGGCLGTNSAYGSSPFHVEFVIAEPIYYNLTLTTTYTSIGTVPLWGISIVVTGPDGYLINVAANQTEFYWGTLDPGAYTITVNCWASVSAGASATMGWNVNLALEEICPADIAPEGGDEIVGIDDLFFILAEWGQTKSPADIAPPVGDNMVGIDDLFVVLDAWGGCP
jgi:hypothetical protein